MCNFEGCPIKNPVYNFEGNAKGIFCNKHKLDGMQDVCNKKC